MRTCIQNIFLETAIYRIHFHILNCMRNMTPARDPKQPAFKQNNLGSMRRHHGEAVLEEKSWRSNHGREIMEEWAWRRGHGGEIVEEKSWRGNHGLEIMQE